MPGKPSVIGLYTQLLLFFFKPVYYFVSDMCVEARGQLCGIDFLLPSWVLGIEFGSLGLLACTPTHCAILPT